MCEVAIYKKYDGTVISYIHSFCIINAAARRVKYFNQYTYEVYTEPYDKCRFTIFKVRRRI